MWTHGTARNNSKLIRKHGQLAEFVVSVAGNLPVGPERIDALKRAGRFRSAFLRQIAETSQSRTDEELRVLYCEFVEGLTDHGTRVVLQEQIRNLDRSE